MLPFRLFLIKKKFSPLFSSGSPFSDLLFCSDDRPGTCRTQQGSCSIGRSSFLSGFPTQADAYPEQTQRQQFHEQQDAPSESARQLTSPKECRINRVRFELLVEALISPYLILIGIIFAPPSETYQKPASNILDRPKVQGSHHGHHDKGDDVRKKNTHDQVAELLDMYMANDAHLKNTVKMQATGCAAWARSYWELDLLKLAYDCQSLGVGSEVGLGSQDAILRSESSTIYWSSCRLRSSMFAAMWKTKKITIVVQMVDIGKLIIIFYYRPQMDNQRGQAPKARKEKKKNSETGLLMGQNTNIFSQLSATYLQSKPSTTSQQLSFVKQTQIIQYHDPNINRLIGLLRKKADVTKSKAAVELREEIMKMDEPTLGEFILTFSHLFLEIIINEHSKQTVDEFVNMMNYVLTNFKKVAIKEIATIFGPLLVINRSYNLSQQKIYAMLFNGTQDQMHEKAILLLLNKNVTKKFLVFCRVIIECEESQKIGQYNFQRNCSSLLKVLKELIRSFNCMLNKKLETSELFCKFIQQVNQMVAGKFAQEYFKVGGKAKSSFLQFYQALLSEVARHPDWEIPWESYAKILCQNYLDKDPIVQQTLWKYCNRQFIEATLEIEKSTINDQEGLKQKQKFKIFHKFLPKPDEKLLSAVKLGGQALYRELPSYCQVFPYTCAEFTQSHKSIIHKTTFMRKLMQTILELEDENEVHVQCYYHLSTYFIRILRKLPGLCTQIEEKKQQEVKTVCLKAEKEIVNNLQDKYYKSPPTSRNSFTFYIPQYFCKILTEIEPVFDFVFDKKQTFPLYCLLKAFPNSEYNQSVYDAIFDNCRNDDNLLVQYLESFPSRFINVDMSQKNQKVDQASRIFLLSLESKSPQNWFSGSWDIRKKIIVLDPRIASSDLSKFQQQQQNGGVFKPSCKNLPNQQLYLRPQNDQTRFSCFLQCLSNDNEIDGVVYMTPFVKDVLFQKGRQNRAKWINQILELQRANIDRLEKKQWVISQIQVLRLRVVCDLVFEGLRRVNADGREQLSSIDVEKLNKFMQNYCLFGLALYNYKLENEAEQILKIIQKAIHIESVSQLIQQSVIVTLKVAYETYNKNFSLTGTELKQGEEKQRRNRLARLLSFIRKLLQYGVNRKKQKSYIEIFQALLLYEGWKFAQIRVQLWLICEAILQNADANLLKKVSQKIATQFKKYSRFLALLMCCHLILPLQRHPLTKKIMVELQVQFFKVLKQRNNDKQNCEILDRAIVEATSSGSYLLINGVKNCLRNLMKNYQKMNAEHLGMYIERCFLNPLSNLANSQSDTLSINCFLLRSLCNQLPLLDFPGSEECYTKLLHVTLAETTGPKKLGYFSVIGSIWQSGVGTKQLATNEISLIIGQFIACIKQSISQIPSQSTNFARYCGLTFLNQFLQILPKEDWNDWPFILEALILAPVQQGTNLHGEIQSARYKIISKIFVASPKQLQKKLAQEIPEEILVEIRLYKQLLDHIENDDQEDQNNQGNRLYQNILNMFIQFAEVLVRMTGSLSAEIKPKEELILELLQCPFAGLKKTAFILLKQMYHLRLVQKMPPPVFLSYLKLDSQITKVPLDPLIANIVSGYLYSWQAVIERRGATESSSSQEEQNGILLEDYLQTEQLHELFLKNMFEVLEGQLQYTKNQYEFEMSAQELRGMDSIVAIEDDLNLHKKMFRLIARTLLMFIQNFPLFLRDFVDRNKRFRVACDRLLRNVISDAIFRQEIARIELRQHEWKAAGNFQIYVIEKNKQIYAEYTHDVIRIGLRLVMKGNYPIRYRCILYSPISVQFGQGLKIQEGSRWALMLQTQLHNRNNTIINGILLWKENIDKKLGGVEQCAICFDIVNGNGQLPRKGCKTCKKKFHSVCIMKWFNKSNKSECPLCKSQFL